MNTTLNEYYLNQDENSVQKTDLMKRDTSNLHVDDAKYPAKRKLMLQLFEPLQNNLQEEDQHRKSEFLHTKQKSWKKIWITYLNLFKISLTVS